ncbi:MAG: MerR family transcriptional regulator [Acidimicrobiia bacterium]|nr:MerR family transcriptional regulator [Acidimicrobiia bacterium]
MEYSIGEVAKIAGVSVRTLHHYDEKGLVVPQRSATGYRHYDSAAIDMLQQVLFFRELGFPLADIGEILAQPDFDRIGVLRRQREYLVGKSARLSQLIDTIDRAIEETQGERTMSADEKLKGFDQGPHAAEAKERWGDTEAYAHSQKRLSGYSKEDVEAAKQEAEDIAARFGELMRSGASSDSPQAVQLAEAHRLHIDRWWYPCSKQMHANLGDLYVQDQRFTDYWDKHEPGLARFVSEAITANAA